MQLYDEYYGTTIQDLSTAVAGILEAGQAQRLYDSFQDNY